jgi:hypothetical protein
VERYIDDYRAKNTATYASRDEIDTLTAEAVRDLIRYAIVFRPIVLIALCFVGFLESSKQEVSLAGKQGIAEGHFIR